MATGVRKDPFRNCNFVLEIAGITQAGFSDVTGIGSVIELLLYQEGGDIAPRKLPGQVSYPNITLKWGLTDSRELYDWHRDVIRGVVRRLDGSIILQDVTGVEQARWNLFSAWPSNYEGPALSGQGKEVAIESLQIVCESVERV
jgi:phage tail-like protein